MINSYDIDNQTEDNTLQRIISTSNIIIQQYSIIQYSYNIFILNNK